MKLISKGIETASAVRHAPPRTHGSNSPTLMHAIAPLVIIRAAQKQSGEVQTSSDEFIVDDVEDEDEDEEEEMWRQKSVRSLTSSK
ncbi:hypothetical protein F511_42038 [Dorcoceras hygrometricum]|uniref:Uncharacterized protein n=1 Tax=Dorcoceras hygrometricum TaxID=472368 RepID=A0A2Z7CT15_9LAMI|nr:hypothetical protein F511_42038 [Dorcoceras hygrometricum]